MCFDIGIILSFRCVILGYPNVEILRFSSSCNSYIGKTTHIIKIYLSNQVPQLLCWELINFRLYPNIQVYILSPFMTEFQVLYDDTKGNVLISAFNKILSPYAVSVYPGLSGISCCHTMMHLPRGTIGWPRDSHDKWQYTRSGKPLIYNGSGMAGI